MRVLKRGADKYLSANLQYMISLMQLSFLLFLLAALVVFIDMPPYTQLALMALPLAYTLGVYAYRRHILWRSGLAGESLVTQELEKLGDEYSLINGVVIPPNRGDTDHIVLGPNGIFVIESKNYGGEIRCEGDEWFRHKKSKKGNRYGLEVGSPSRQAKRNAKVLKDFILEHGGGIFEGKIPHIWIHSMVVFTNKNLKANLKKPTVDVLRIDELADYIKGKESELVLSSGEVRKISEAILVHST